MYDEKKKLTGKQQVNNDELNGFENIPFKNNDTLQCPKCKAYYEKIKEHKCKELNFWSSVCSICNRSLYEWVKLPNGYSKHKVKHKSVIIWSKPICEGCIIQAQKEFKKQ